MKSITLMVFGVILLCAEYVDAGDRSFDVRTRAPEPSRVSVETLDTGDCNDYIDLSGEVLPIQEAGTTVGATNDYGPFAVWPQCWRGAWDSGACSGRDRTYKWTVPHSGRYTISLCGSTYDTGLLVFAFTCPDEPSYPEDFICGNDDLCGLQSELYCIEYAAGQELLIVVDGYGNSAGNYELRISEYQPAPDLDSYIETTMLSAHLPGVSACGIAHGEVVWTGNYGFANIAEATPPTDSTLYILASVSKTIVAAALMQLWEDGLFNLDDDINLYLPWSVRHPVWPGIPITFRMLATHTSGIADNWDVLDPLYVFGIDSPIPLGSFLEDYLVPGGAYYSGIANFGDYAPGTGWNYCNIGAALAGYLVEVLNPEDASFEDYCQAHLFEPLGMNNSSFFQANLNMDEAAVPYYWSGQGYNSYEHYGYPDYPDGQLRTSTAQLARYLIACMQYGQLDGTRILDSSTVNMMCAPMLDQSVWGGYNFGVFWNHRNWWGREMVGHPGSEYGSRTEMWYDKDRGIGAIVLTNGEDLWSPRNILNEVFEYVERTYVGTAPRREPAYPSIEILTAYPNPFNSTLSIALSLPPHQDATITLYDLLGRQVDVIYRGRLLSNTITYSAPDRLASGVYFVRAKAGDLSAVKKVALVK